MMPDVGGEGDALSGSGQKGPGPDHIRTTGVGMWRHQYQPARHVGGDERLRRKAVTLHHRGDEGQRRWCTVCRRQARPRLGPGVCQCLTEIFPARGDWGHDHLSVWRERQWG